MWLWSMLVLHVIALFYRPCSYALHGILDHDSSSPLSKTDGKPWESIRTGVPMGVTRPFTTLHGRACSIDALGPPTCVQARPFGWNRGPSDRSERDLVS
jgi:hypothetical protein